MHSQFPPGIHKVCIHLAAIFLSLAQPCFAFKPDFYSPFNNSKEYDALLEIEASADRELKCRSIDEIDIGVGTSIELKELPRDLEPGMALDFPKDTSKPRILKRKVFYFKSNEIETFLQMEKHKNLLVIRIFGWFKRENKTALLKQCNQLFDHLGYRRVLVLGTDPSGIYVVQDSEEVKGKGQTKSTQRKDLK